MLIPLAFVLISVVVELTPGPNMVYLVVLTAREGRWAGFAATLGVALGLSAVAAAAAFGLTAIIATSRWLYKALRWGGALYLLWLAWEGMRGAKASAPRGIAVEPRYSKFLLQGFMTNALNPKAGLTQPSRGRRRVMRHGCSTAAPTSAPFLSAARAALASRSGYTFVCVLIPALGAIARNASPSARVRLATETICRSSQSKR